MHTAEPDVGSAYKKFRSGILRLPHKPLMQHMGVNLMQMLLLIVRQQMEPVSVKKGQAFESFGRKYVVEQVIGYFEDHYAENFNIKYRHCKYEIVRITPFSLPVKAENHNAF